jgi:hypothetical protein
VDNIDSNQLRQVYKKRQELSDVVKRHGFNWDVAVVRSYPEHIYNTCAIEGNSLRLQEVEELMEQGLQTGG